MKKSLITLVALVLVVAFTMSVFAATNLVTKTTKLNSTDWSFLNGVLKNKKDDIENFVIFDGLKLNEKYTYTYKGKLKYTKIQKEGWMGARIIFRMNNADSYLCFSMMQNGDLKILQRDVKAGGWAELAGGQTFKFQVNKEYAFEITTAPTSVDVKLDGKTIFSKVKVPQMKANFGQLSVHSFTEMKSVEVSVKK